MRDDQRSDNPSEPDDRREAFDDALDDLFGPGTTLEPNQTAAPPPPTTFDQERYPRQESQPAAQPAPPYIPPPQRSSGPGIRGWTWRKTGCYTCLGFFGVIFACLVILFVIGLVAGDPADPAPAGGFWVGVA